MPKTLLSPLAALLWALAAATAHADAPRQIKWNDLLPPLSADHPFSKLTRCKVQLDQIAGATTKRRGDAVPTVQD
jgi:hypothetical protein